MAAQASSRVTAVFPLASLNLSGGVKNLLVQAEALSQAGYEVTVLVPADSPRPPLRIPPSVTLKPLATGPRRLPRPLRSLLYYARLALASSANADLCVVAYYPTVFCAVVSRVLTRSRARIVYSVAAYEPFTHGQAAEAGLTRRLRAALAQLSYRLPVERVYASHWLRDMVGDRSGRVIGRGINLDVFKPGPEQHNDGPLRIGVVARSGAVKGYDEVRTALESLRGRSDVLVRLIAVDSIRPPEGLPVEMLPPQNEAGMAAFYQGCDVFVFASLSEGFPAPPLEAMACGCAVVTTDCGGVREYAVDDVNCLLVPPGQPLALAQALRRLLDDPTMRQRLAAEAARTAQKLPTVAMVERFLAAVA